VTALPLTIRGPEDLVAIVPMAQPTRDRLARYAALLIKWQRSINLVAPKTLPDLWSRHMADSLQIATLIPSNTRKIADLGAGAGFPGLVLAAYFADTETSPCPTVTLVESDRRKAAFLREAARIMEISVEILSTRIENDANLNALRDIDVFTARALAPLSRLFEFVAPYHVGDRQGARTCIFLKGRQAPKEIEDARKSGWVFDVTMHPSKTDTDASIVVVEHLELNTRSD